MIETWSLSGDLGLPYIIAAGVLATISLTLLLLELRRREGKQARVAAGIALSGIAALLSLLFAVLRPVRIHTRGGSVGPRLAVLLDASRSVDLPRAGQELRRDAIARALPALRRHFKQTRVSYYTFGRGSPQPLLAGAGGFDAKPQTSSDLSAALEALAAATEEEPQAIVVVTDGRLDRPSEQRTEAELRQAVGRLTVPVHTVAIAETAPADASVVAVRLPSAIVAHQPTALTVEIACTGGLECHTLPVIARELHLDSKPVKRAAATATIVDGRGSVELSIVLDRAGKRILEVGFEAPEGDEIAANNRRYLTVDVTRDRVRLLHIAGRPTYDVRALRMWLKSDASVDVVAFFILRTHTDDVVAPQQELALIPFPVDELFTTHLPSFDAVILQDFDAQPYGLEKHLPALAHYVRQGGGLIMVGGPNAFVSGNYAQTALASVLAVSLDGVSRRQAIDFASFVPAFTDAGRRAPVLQPLRGLLGDTFPQMPGVNIVGDARRGATVLLDHPQLKTQSGASMPVLALGEYSSGRTIALAVDGSHKLLFSKFAASAAGRAHGAFWDALLGWLMRDPRFEPAKISLPGGCIAGVESTMLLRTVFGEGTKAKVVIARMGSGQVVGTHELSLVDGDEAVEVPLGKLSAGGYTATVEVIRGPSDSGAPTAPSRHDFACEQGGEEWADVRPDPERLQRIAQATGGQAVTVEDIDSLPRPEAAKVITERRVEPILPPWSWSLAAAFFLGAHWLARRRSGLS